ncbi:MAG: hypothetical protein ABIH67_00945 [Candidatus Uhrbacteria bacterium]
MEGGAWAVGKVASAAWEAGDQGGSDSDAVHGCSPSSCDQSNQTQGNPYRMVDGEQYRKVEKDLRGAFSPPKAMRCFILSSGYRETNMKTTEKFKKNKKPLC